jgi:hypothetical protein
VIGNNCFCRLYCHCSNLLLLLRDRLRAIGSTKTLLRVVL